MVKLNLFGDICLHGIEWKNYRFDPQLQALMQDAVNVGNLENPICDPLPGDPVLAVRLRSAPDSLGLLSSFSAVSLANNHIRDCGELGCRQTIAALQEQGIGAFGLGDDARKALAPLIIEREGVRVALFGATRYANADSAPGTAPDAIRPMRKLIRRLKAEGSFVIPFFHWGYEYVRIPAPRERAIAHACIDAGADLVVGAHPHVYQAVEEYRGKTIVYSLGNFVFHSAHSEGLSPIPNDPRLRESFLARIAIRPDLSHEVSLHGFRTSDTGVTLMGEDDNARLLDEVHATSAVLKQNRWSYTRAYYRQARAICAKNIKVRRQFQKVSERSLRDRLRIYLAFNAQDLKNRFVYHLAGLFG